MVRLSTPPKLLCVGHCPPRMTVRRELCIGRLTFHLARLIMATIVHEGPSSERRTSPRRNGDHTTLHRSANLIDVQGMSVSWGGVWGGVLIGMGLLMLLTALGLALGVSAVDPNSDSQSLGTPAAIWAAISLLLALYIGGMAS